MSMSSIPSSSQSGKLYGWVERIGNKVPHPFLLFIYLIIVLMVTTAILSAFGVSAKNPTDGTPVVVKNLLSVEGLHWFLPNVIKNFSGFATLGAILALFFQGLLSFFPVIHSLCNDLIGIHSFGEQCL